MIYINFALAKQQKRVLGSNPSVMIGDPMFMIGMVSPEKT